MRAYVFGLFVNTGGETFWCKRAADDAIVSHNRSQLKFGCTCETLIKLYVRVQYSIIGREVTYLFIYIF